MTRDAADCLADYCLRRAAEEAAKGHPIRLWFYCGDIVDRSPRCRGAYEVPLAYSRHDLGRWFVWIADTMPAGGAR